MGNVGKRRWECDPGQKKQIAAHLLPNFPAYPYVNIWGLAILYYWLCLSGLAARNLRVTLVPPKRTARRSNSKVANNDQLAFSMIPFLFNRCC